MADERQEQDDPAQQPRPSDEELFEELKRLKVSDVVVQTLFTVSSLGYHKLAQKELGEAKLAIEALRVLVPVVEGQVDEHVVRDFRQVTANLQLAYAEAASPESAPEPG
jgi:hypothetical protein